MTKAVRLFLPIFVLCLSFVGAAMAQDQYNEGNIERVTLLRILPGHSNAFWEDVKSNIEPIWNEEKSQGLIEGYQVFINQTKAGIDDWDIGVAVTYKNMAALDGLGMKVLDLRMKKYGNKSNEQQVINKRVENYQVVDSYLIRNVTLK
jgi:hypothetical protein